MAFLVRLLINAAALFVAAWLVPGIHLNAGDRLADAHDWATLAVVALLFGVVNAIIRPVVFWLTLPLTLVTLGLFTLVINALMLMLTSRIAEALAVGFGVDGFGAAFVGALVISVVGLVLGHLVRGA
jgi:putative membrane protein